MRGEELIRRAGEEVAANVDDVDEIVRCKMHRVNEGDRRPTGALARCLADVVDLMHAPDTI